MHFDFCIKMRIIAYRPYSYKYLKFSRAEWIMLVYYQGILNRRGPQKIINLTIILYLVDYFGTAAGDIGNNMQSCRALTS